MYFLFYSCITLPYGISCLAVLRPRVGLNNMFCISRDTVWANQQLPSLYSLGVSKKGCKKRLRELHGNVWAQSSEFWLCWFFVEFFYPGVVIFFQPAGQWSSSLWAASDFLQQARGVLAPVDFPKFVHISASEPRLQWLLSAVSIKFSPCKY
jgi:hypothetical protein